MNLCRLCKREVQSRSQPKTKFTKEIRRAFDTDVETECSCASNKVCESCRKDLQAYRKHYQHKRSKFKFKCEDIAPVQHQPDCSHHHDPQITIQPTLQQVADQAAKANNFASWMQSDTLLYAQICKDANSPFQVQLESDGSWKILSMGKLVCRDVIPNVPTNLNTDNVNILFESLSTMQLCQGNPEFSDVCRSRFPDSLAVFVDCEQKPCAHEEIISDSSTTVRVIDCNRLTNKQKCTKCTKYKLTLNTMKHRLSNKVIGQGPATNHTKHSAMNRTELRSALKEAKADNKNLKRELKKMKSQISKETNKHGVTLDENQNEEFVSIMDSHNAEIEKEFQEDSNHPNLLLWKQHAIDSKNKNSKQNRWHPLVLKWCIGLQYKSSAAYEFVRNSGVISLPSKSTLRRYTQFTQPKPGYNEDVIKRLIEDTKLNTLSEDMDYKRNVSIIFDEIKVKAGLVYKAKTGKLIGYTDLGTINNELMDFSRRVTLEGKAGAPELATHVLSVMVRGIFSALHTSIAWFPTSTATGDQLYQIIWNGVEVLESVGFHVRAFVADGASTNRKFFKLHSADRHRLTHCTANRYGDLYSAGRDVYFICDPPHLLKTVRNNWENSGFNNKTRTLTFKKQCITWQQLINMYENLSQTNSTTSPGITPLYKITQDHLYLNPSLRMKVKLAAQVLSKTVADGFLLEGRTDTKSTIQFVQNIDKFFDCLNVKSFYQGVRQRKQNCLPYTSPDDERLQWLLKDFIGWLDEWEQEALSTPNLTRNQQRKLCLSEQTLDGLRITVFSFVSLAHELLQLPGVKYLCSEKLNQDPQEEAFSKVRAVGGCRTNPTVDQYGDAAIKIQVGGACIRGSLKGNCKRQPVPEPMRIHKKGRKESQ